MPSTFRIKEGRAEAMTMIPKLGGSGAHILLFPYPAQGHMIPLLDLAHFLATRGLTITILVTPKNLSLLTSLLSLHPSSITPLTLTFPNCTSLPAGIENHINLPSGNYFRFMIHALEGLHDPLLHWWTNHESPPVAIVSDMFLGWTHRLAARLGVPRLVFSPSGAMSLSIMYSLWHGLRDQNHYGPKARAPEQNTSPEAVSFLEIPNSPKYPWWQLSPLYRAYMAGDPVSESVRVGFLGDMASWGLVVNTFARLEEVYLDHLKKFLGHDRVWAVGPLLSQNGPDPVKRGGSSAESASEVLSWLDTCQDRSVVYVCFGSVAMLTDGQMDALALGLERSGARFVWCTRESAADGHLSGQGQVPQGFEERTEKRGRVVRGWAPQVAILSHKAVGVFLTHCGWNSVLESILAGVPMLAWPMSADQFTDATLLVDQLRVAVSVWEGDRAMPDSDDLARLFTEALGEGRAEGVRAAELREAALEAVDKGGSSWNDLDELVKRFHAMCAR